jgi:hypothetical protein
VNERHREPFGPLPHIGGEPVSVRPVAEMSQPPTPARGSTPNRSERWPTRTTARHGASDQKQLKDLAKGNTPTGIIAMKLGRTERAVRSKGRLPESAEPVAVQSPEEVVVRWSLSTSRRDGARISAGAGALRVTALFTRYVRPPFDQFPTVPGPWGRSTLGGRQTEGCMDRDHVSQLVQQALDEFDERSLGTSARRAYRIARLLGNVDVAHRLQLELRTSLGSARSGCRSPSPLPRTYIRRGGGASQRRARTVP